MGRRVEAVARLRAERRLPVFLNGSGRGALPPDHELFFQHARRVAVDEADVVCVIGTPLDFRLSFGRFGADTKLVHIHADATELGRNRAPDAGIGCTASWMRMPTTSNTGVPGAVCAAACIASHVTRLIPLGGCAVRHGIALIAGKLEKIGVTSEYPGGLSLPRFTTSSVSFPAMSVLVQ